jgi:hypothetical protein
LNNIDIFENEEVQTYNNLFEINKKKIIDSMDAKIEWTEDEEELFSGFLPNDNNANNGNVNKK